MLSVLALSWLLVPNTALAAGGCANAECNYIDEDDAIPVWISRLEGDYDDDFLVGEEVPPYFAAFDGTGAGNFEGERDLIYVAIQDGGQHRVVSKYDDDAGSPELIAWSNEESSARFASFYFAGQQNIDGWDLEGFDGYSSALTGQYEDWRIGCKEGCYGTWSHIEPNSMAGRVMGGEVFPVEDLYFAAVFNTQYNNLENDDMLDHMVEAWANFIEDKVDESQLEVLHLAGSSRGGCLAFRIARELKFHRSATWGDVPIVLQSIDPNCNVDELDGQPKDVDEFHPFAGTSVTLWDGDVDTAWSGLKGRLADMKFVFPLEQRTTLAIKTVLTGSNGSGKNDIDGISPVWSMAIDSTPLMDTTTLRRFKRPWYEQTWMSDHWARNDLGELAGQSVASWIHMAAGRSLHPDVTDETVDPFVAHLEEQVDLLTCGALSAPSPYWEGELDLATGACVCDQPNTVWDADLGHCECAEGSYWSEDAASCTVIPSCSVLEGLVDDDLYFDTTTERCEEYCPGYCSTLDQEWYALTGLEPLPWDAACVERSCADDGYGCEDHTRLEVAATGLLGACYCVDPGFVETAEGDCIFAPDVDKGVTDESDTDVLSGPGTSEPDATEATKDVVAG